MSWDPENWQGTDTGDEPTNNSDPNEKRPTQWNTNTSYVPWNYSIGLKGTADNPIYRYAEESATRPGEYAVTGRTFNRAREYPARLRAQARDPLATPEQRKAYGKLLGQLRDYSGSKLGTDGSVDTAWDQLLVDAQEGNTPALQLLAAGGDGSGDGSGSGGGSRYGTTSSVTHANEADVRALANTVAENMIGRNLSDKEFNKIYGRFRSGEAASPTVTTGSPGGSVTQQGATAQERQDILEEIIMENPEFSTYQGGEGMLDKMTDINKQVRSENAGL
jgi:hypothetical protein